MRGLRIWKQLIVLIVLLLVGCTDSGQDNQLWIYQVNADGTESELLIGSDGQTFWGPAVSPDGSQIVVLVQDLGDSSGELVLYDLEDGTSIPLTDNAGVSWFPVWSPDGQHIIYLLESDPSDASTADIYLLNVENGTQQALVQNDAFEYGMSWSPDGDRFAFGSEQGGAWQIYIMNLTTRETSPLDIPQHGNSPSWSPDGEWLVFTSDRDGDDDIYRSRIDGSALENLTDNDFWDDNPRWSPDGTYIVFTSDRDDLANIYTMNIDTGEVLKLTHDFQGSVGFADWSPTGESIIFQGPADS